MLIKRNILSFLARYQYPQRVFGKALVKSIKCSTVKSGTILDCPCGNGEVSYQLNTLPNFTVHGIDNDIASINTARTNFKNSNIIFTTEDIFTILSSPQTYDVICIINSFFLLPNHTTLLSEVKKKLKNSESLLFIIIPNIEGRNFKNFEKKYPNTNIKTYSKHQFSLLLTDNNFIVKSINHLAHTHVYGKDKLKFLSVFASFYLLIASKINSIIKPQTSNYLMYNCTACFEKN